LSADLLACFAVGGLTLHEAEGSRKVLHLSPSMDDNDDVDEASRVPLRTKLPP